MKRLLTLLTLLALCCLLGLEAAAAPRAKDFAPVCDTLRVRLLAHTGVDQKLRMNKVKVRGGKLDLYFSAELSYYPWHAEDLDWFYRELKGEMASIAGDSSLGEVYTNGYSLSELVLPQPGSDGKPSAYSGSIADPRGSDPGFVRRVGARKYPKGLDGRYIALWQSHGRYYDEERGSWSWQRAPLHRTVEDMFTQSFVLPFLMPMLENSGAYVMTPRERDIQRQEYIIDNDPAFPGERSGELRRSGSYREHGTWKTAGTGFADFKQIYTFSDNPFTAGTARKADCSPKGGASVRWTAQVEKRGEYAVYVSYRTEDNSSTGAHYSVHHLGGSTDFTVNQKRGGGTWIYLGTFEFGPEGECCVTLDNRGENGTCVTADAVKIGGGMGKLERGGSTSGMASSAEGAHYWMQWAGADATVTRNWDTDYTNDFASRGRWTTMMHEQKDIPFDLALAFHTDAGTAQADTTIGTLAIYTLRNEGEREFADGRDRIISRLLCDYVQSQIVDDIRADFDPDWTRRGLWDKSYSECRTAGVPAMILELLSHQNFADMRYGLDPAFRFTVSRAVYKGILKTLSEYYGCPYSVQPLPVSAFSARLLPDERIRLEWTPTPDSKEPTAVSRGYIVYTRRDGGAFDSGVETLTPSLELPLERGHIYSFKVEAFNDGGRSFPSEILSAGVPDGAGVRDTILIVNNFYRVSAPAVIDSPEYAGFDSRRDGGVPYIRDISYIGENYEFDRSAGFVDNDYPGFGASDEESAGEVIAGNSFDYPYVHGKSLMALGYPFCSSSKDAFCTEDNFPQIIDLICGKQGGERYPVFPGALRDALSAFLSEGGSLFLSGANIASDSTARAFTPAALGYRLSTPSGSRSGRISGMEYASSLNPEIYCVENPDGIFPAGSGSGIWLRYPRSSFGAATYSTAGGHKVAAMAVPFETIIDESDRTSVLRAVLEYFDGGSKPVHHR
jgi:hypothetical protein